MREDTCFGDSLESFYELSTSTGDSVSSYGGTYTSNSNSFTFINSVVGMYQFIATLILPDGQTVSKDIFVECILPQDCIDNTINVPATFPSSIIYDLYSHPNLDS